MNKLSMKVKSTLFHSLLAAAAMLMLAHGNAQAQSSGFTITNGTAQWHEAANGNTYPTAYKSTGTPKFSSDAVASSDVTYDVQVGNRFVALDTTGDGSVSSHTAFSQFCVWHMTDNPGYLYQEYTVADGSKTYRYYLRGTTEGVAVWKVVKGESVSTATLWNTTEAGCYIDQSSVRNGVKYTDYRWLSFDGTTITMSCPAEHRPEARRYIDANNTVATWYCPNSAGTGATCSAAVFLPVETVDFEPSIDHPSGSNRGLADITLTGNTPLANNSQVTASPQYTAEALSGDATYNYTPAYRMVSYYTRL